MLMCGQTENLRIRADVRDQLWMHDARQNHLRGSEKPGAGPNSRWTEL